MTTLCKQRSETNIGSLYTLTLVMVAEGKRGRRKATASNIHIPIRSREDQA